MYIKLCMYTYIKYLNLYYTPGCFSLGSYNQQMLISRINSIISVQKHFLEASPWIWSTFQPIKRTIWSGARVAHPLPSNFVVSWGFTGARHVVVSTCCFTGLVRVGLKFPQSGNRANVYAHVVVVREHVRRTLCSVCATGARVAQPFLSNS